MKRSAHFPSRITRQLIALVVAVLTGSPVCSQGVASQAEAWLRRPVQEKIGFLEGFCSGVTAISPTDTDIGEMSCNRIGEQKKKNAMRFCGLVWGPIPKGQIIYLDRFYASPDHSDVPMWAAISLFNDMACDERTVVDRIHSLQERGECKRRYATLLQADVAKEVRDRYYKTCEQR